MRLIALYSPCPERWAIHQQALQLFRDFDALQRVRPEAMTAGVPDLLRLPGSRQRRALERWRQHGEAFFMWDWCPPSLVECLHLDEGLQSFARRADREQELLKRIALRLDSELVVAHTPEGC